MCSEKSESCSATFCILKLQEFLIPDSHQKSEVRRFLRDAVYFSDIRGKYKNRGKKHAI